MSRHPVPELNPGDLVKAHDAGDTTITGTVVGPGRPAIGVPHMTRVRWPSGDVRSVPSRGLYRVDEHGRPA